MPGDPVRVLNAGQRKVSAPRVPGVRDDPRDEGGKDDAQHLVEARKTPDAAVEPEQPEHEDADRRVPRRKAEEGGQILLRDRGVLKIEAQKQPAEKGDVDHQRIVNDQNRADDAPVLDGRLAVDPIQIIILDGIPVAFDILHSTVSSCSVKNAVMFTFQYSTPADKKQALRAGARCQLLVP